MDETVIVIMIKEKRSGFLEKELVSCAVKKHDELLLNAFAVNEDDGVYIVLKLTCAEDVSDEEFDAIFDYYDETIYNEIGVSCREADDCFNPTWEFSFKYDEAAVQEKINLLLDMHAEELRDVYEAMNLGN